MIYLPECEMDATFHPVNPNGYRSVPSFVVILLTLAIPHSNHKEVMPWKSSVMVKLAEFS